VVVLTSTQVRGWHGKLGKLELGHGKLAASPGNAGTALLANLAGAIVALAHGYEWWLRQQP